MRVRGSWGEVGWDGEGRDGALGRGVVVVVMAEVALLLVLPRGFATEICVVIVDGGGERVAWEARGGEYGTHCWGDGQTVHHRVSQYCHLHAYLPIPRTPYVRTTPSITSSSYFVQVGAHPQ